MPHARFFISFSLATALAALAAPASHAQSNAPLTGGMSGGVSASGAPPAGAAAALPERPVVQQVSTPLPAEAPAAPQAAAQPAAPEGFGDVTRGLLAAQADGRRAGGALPILGPVSTAAWNRYLDSFKHPIPEWMQKRVETKNTR
ncbi:hypothetical protein D9M68_732780 [compost metagenome]|uniref:TapA domain-containing protein n=1 Tax=Achromobacter agilis TaxID=1353888 RepID=A0A446CZ28_9BURK|nr:DUF3613 domain-containing protein [Achromobacter agilis]SSW73103.1 hypothetical protein AGI3411_05876 [Achromobacter agilis]